jgi:hypothetical protein
VLLWYLASFLAVTEFLHKQLKRRKDSFWLTTPEGQSVIIWPHVLEQNIMVAGVSAREYRKERGGSQEGPRDKIENTAQ